MSWLIAVACLAGQDIVVEMDGGVKEVRAGRTTVRVEMVNNEGKEFDPPKGPVAGTKLYRREAWNEHSGKETWV